MVFLELGERVKRFSAHLTEVAVNFLCLALIRLRICAGWSEPLLVAHSTLLEISCHGSHVSRIANKTAALITYRA